MTFIKHHLKYLPWFFAGVFCVVGSYDHFFNDDQWIARVIPEQSPSVGADVRTFTSAQVGSDPDNGDCLTTDGSISTWSATCGGGGGGSGVGWATTTGNYVLYNTEGKAIVLSPSDQSATTTTDFLNVYGSIAADFFYSSSTASSTLTRLSTTEFYAREATTTSLSIGGDSLIELAGTGLQVIANELQTTLGTAIAPSELSNSDFGEFTCAAGSCTLDNNVVVTGDISDGTIVSADIADGTIVAMDLATTTPLASSSILSINEVGTFTQLTCAQITGSSALCDGNDASAGAGIATSTPIANKEIIYATAINTVGSEAAFTYDSATDLLTVVNATATAASSTNIYGSLGRFLNLVVTTLATFLNVVVTGLMDIGDGSLEIPNGANPTIDSVGEIGVDTTTGQFLFSTSTTDLSVKLPLEINKLAYSSTTWGGTTTIPWGGASGYPLKVYDINCATIGGGTASLVLGSGSATSTVALITGTPATTTLNIAFHGGEMPRFEIGTPASSPRYVGCTWRFKYDRQ